VAGSLTALISGGWQSSQASYWPPFFTKLAASPQDVGVAGAQWAPQGSRHNVRGLSVEVVRRDAATGECCLGLGPPGPAPEPVQVSQHAGLASTEVTLPS
jgi:hypothetical protein